MRFMNRGVAAVAFLAASTLLLWHARAAPPAPVHVVSTFAVLQTKSATSGALFSGATVRAWRAAPASVRKHLARAAALRARDAAGVHRPPAAPGGRACRHYAVVTTIFAPSSAVNDTCHRLPDWCLVVAADGKGPETYPLDGPCAQST